MIDIYYPYFQREAIWQELRYSLRSLQKYLKEDFRIWIVGDKPDWIKNINHIPHERCEGMQENSTYDAITKLMIFCNNPLTGQDFIRIYDDSYLLTDISFEKIKRIRALYKYEEMPFESGTWWNQLRKTLDILVKKGYPGWNTETHFPEFFNKFKMQWIIDAYKARENRLLTSSLYYNTLFPNMNPDIFSKEWGIQFYENQDNEYYSSSDGDLEAKCHGKLFMNHNNSGLTENLKRFISARFPEKSKFEK
jgi:hypothetical protein